MRGKFLIEALKGVWNLKSIRKYEYIYIYIYILIRENPIKFYIGV